MELAEARVDIGEQDVQLRVLLKLRKELRDERTKLESGKWGEWGGNDK